MTNTQEVPTAGQPASHANQPSAKFEIEDIAVIATEGGLDDRGKQYEVAIIIEAKRYVEGGWEYSGARKDGEGNSISQQYPEHVLEKPKHAIGQRVRVAKLPNNINAGTVMGYVVDSCNVLHYDIQRDLAYLVADQLVKIDG